MKKFCYPLILAAASSAALAQPQYTVTDLGRLPGYSFSTVALDLNNRGEVVGFAQGGATYQAFIWSAARDSALPPVPGEESRSSTAVAINDNGDIIGYSGQSGGAHMVGWIYRNGQYTMLGAVPGYDGSLPAAINNLGEVVGRATGLNSTDPSTNFYWSASSGIVNLVANGVAEFYGINDAGIICGGLRSGNGEGITTWNVRTGEVVDLGKLPGAALSFGYDINESGRIAGVNTFYDISGHATAYAVQAAPGQGVGDLGVVHAAALGINERGEIIGSRPFGSNSTYYSWLYTPLNGLTTNLQTIISDTTNFPRISGARAINDRGQIIASGENGHFPADTFRRALLLTPISACYADCDGIGGLTPNDFQCFLTRYATGDAAADCDSIGGLTPNDFQCFLDHYATGCS